MDIQDREYTTRFKVRVVPDRAWHGVTPEMEQEMKDLGFKQISSMERTQTGLNAEDKALGVSYLEYYQRLGEWVTDGYTARIYTYSEREPSRLLICEGRDLMNQIDWGRPYTWETGINRLKELLCKTSNTK